MTAEGHAALDAELKHLKSVERPAVIQAISEAREHGDLSENAEYHAAKEKQSFIEGRVAELEDKLARAEVIDVTKLKGDKVVLWYLSANRDEEVFENPDKLDIQRDNARRHIAFGYGIHRCVGARLAELQLRILLEELHKRRMRVHVAGDIERVRANFVHGFRKLEVEITDF